MFNNKSVTDLQELKTGQAPKLQWNPVLKNKKKTN